METSYAKRGGLTKPEANTLQRNALPVRRKQVHLSNHHEVLAFHGLVLSVMEKAMLFF
jgi:hypothetical protein